MPAKPRLDTRSLALSDENIDPYSSSPLDGYLNILSQVSDGWEDAQFWSWRDPQLSGSWPDPVGRQINVPVRDLPVGPFSTSRSNLHCDPAGPDFSLDADAEICLIKMHSVFADPTHSDDANALRCFAEYSAADLWSVDMRLTLLWSLAYEARRRKRAPALDLWLAIIQDTRERIDWSMWDDGDEAWLRHRIVEHRMTSRFRSAALELSPSDWMRARNALQRRMMRPRPASPLASWSTQRRVLRIAWCAVTDGIPVGELDYPRLKGFVKSWAHFTCPFRLSYGLEVKRRLHSQPNCSLASCKVGTWQWFKAAMWDYDVARIQDIIGCCARCVSGALLAINAPRLTSPVDEPAVWPVVLWVAFQAQSDGAKTIDDFVAIIRANDSATLGLWAWDETDEQILRAALRPEHSWRARYPASWRKYIDLLDASGWVSLEALTRQASRARLAPLTYDTAVRIGAVVLWASSASTAAAAAPPREILLSLETFLPRDPTLDTHGFLRCLLERRVPARAHHYELDLGPETVDWRHSQIWLRRNGAQLRSNVLQDPSVAPLVHVVENVYMVHHVQRALPLRFMAAVFAGLLKNATHDTRRLDEFRAWIHVWTTWDTMACLLNFRAVLSTTFEFSKAIKEDDLPKAVINVVLRNDILCVCAQLAAILGDRSAYQDFLQARADEVPKLLDLMQDVLDYPLLDDGVRPAILKALLKLSSKSGLHPRCFALSDRLHLESRPVAAGSFGDVWKGRIHGETVSVKVMRVYQEADVEALLQAFSHEALIWRQLAHPNLLPFYGAYYLEGTKSQLCLVSPWMENGHVARYLKGNPVGVNKLSLVLDVALGMEHLHSLRLVHGDLKAINVLVTRSGRAVLADFGLSSVTDSKIVPSTSTAKTGGTMRWQAPELFTGSRNMNTFASDVYAFACVCYEIFTGTLPFHELSDVAVIFRVIQGERPARAAGIAADVWQLMEACWRAAPEERPSAEQVVFRLRDRPICALPTDAAADWDPWSTSKFRSSLEEHTLFLSSGAIEDWLQFTRPKTSAMHASEPILSARTAINLGEKG